MLMKWSKLVSKVCSHLRLETSEYICKLMVLTGVQAIVYLCVCLYHMIGLNTQTPTKGQICGP